MTQEHVEESAALPFPLQDREHVILLCRRHWWFLWPRTILWLIFALAPVFVAAWLLSEIGVLDDLGLIFWGLVLIWLIGWAMRLLLNWYRYQNDIWVINNQRIVDSFKRHPFSLRVGTADLVNVQDMSIEKSGIIATLLDFGDVVCQTAGTGQQFRIAGVPDPRAVQLLVDKERDRERTRER